MFYTSNLNASDIVYPWLQILQSNSRVVETNQAEKGKIYNPLTKEVYDNVNLVILGVKKEFKIFDSSHSRLKYYSPDCEILLRKSENGEWVEIGPLQENELWLNRFGNTSAKTVLTFFATMVENTRDPIYVRISIGGLGYDKAIQLVNAAKLQQKRYFVTRLSVQETTTKHGVKYIPNFEITNDPLPEYLQSVLETEESKKIAHDFFNTQKAIAGGQRQHTEKRHQQPQAISREPATVAR